MKHAVFALFIALLAMVAGGCFITAEYEAKLQSWMGADVNRLITVWGPPTSQYTLPNGSVTYTWRWVGATHATTSTGSSAWDTPGMPASQTIRSTGYTDYCDVMFTVSPDGRVQGWRYQGNSCH